MTLVRILTKCDVISILEYLFLNDPGWAEEHITWCPEKHSLVRRSYRRIKGYYMWEYYDDTYRKHKLLTVDEAIEILISRRNAILELNFGARERPTNEYENWG